MCLNPCHYSFQFVVEDMKYLNCIVNMRSNDLFLGSPFNIFSYAVLTYIVALKCDLKPKTLKFSIGDAHIYMNHLEQVEHQLKRELRPLPMLVLDESIKTKEQ
jgi:thymidylate synthase